MKTCPTCGQNILPSMGKRTSNIQTTGTLILDIQGTPYKLELTKTNRGYRATYLQQKHGQKEKTRTNILITHHPRRNTLSAKIIKKNKNDPNPTITQLEEQLTTYPLQPINHIWETGTTTITLKT